MNSLEALSDHSSYTLKIRSLSSPISTRTRSILFSTKNNKCFILFLIFFCCIKNIHNLICWNIYCLRSYFSFHHFVNYSYVCKCSTSHNQIISSSRSISIKIFLLHSSLLQEPCCRRVYRNISCRWNMISSNRITKNSQYVCILYWL